MRLHGLGMRLEEEPGYEATIYYFRNRMLRASLCGAALNVGMER